MALPSILREELERDAEFMAELGLKQVSVIQVGGMRFETSEFVSAAVRTLNGQESSICPLDSSNPSTNVTLRPSRSGVSGSIGFRVSGDDRDLELSIADTPLELLSTSVSKRLDVLSRHPEWFDREGKEFQRSISEIAAIDDPVERGRTLDHFLKGSATPFYQGLRSSLGNREAFEERHLIPEDLLGLIRHWRLDIHKPFTEAHQKASDALVSEHTFTEAFRRLSALPIPLPRVLKDRFVMLPDDGRWAAIRSILVSDPLSPLATIHVIHLLASGGSRRELRLASRLIRQVCSGRGEAVHDAFVTILRWANERFLSIPLSRSWPPIHRLAVVWAHASRLFACFLSVGVDLGWLRETFGVLRDRVPIEVFERDEEYWIELAHPHQLHRARFVASGLSYATSNAENLVRHETVREVLSISTGDTLVPSPFLLKDPTLCHNQMGSFLAFDVTALLSLNFERELAQAFSPVSLRALATQSLEELNKGTTSGSLWSHFEAVVGDSPAFAEAETTLKEALDKYDFASHISSDPIGGGLALYVACRQARHIRNDETNAHLRRHLLMVAAELKIIARNKQEAISFQLLEDAAHLACANAHTPDSIREYRQCLEEMIAACPELARYARGFVERLFLGVKASSAQHLAPLVRLLRGI